ncbi:MAG: TonB family protein [bacterium]|nr:MAG: TonB family protein [bacterium]
MNTYAMSFEMASSESRTWKTIGISLVIHALILAWLALYRTIAPPPPALTEITWIDPVTIQPPAVKMSVEQPVKRVEKQAPSPQQQPVHFVRKTDVNDFAPQPQTDRAVDDKLRRKLNALEQKVSQRSRIADLVTSKTVGQPALASLPNERTNTKNAVKLSRQENTKQRPVQLTRSETTKAAPAMRLSNVSEKKITPAKLEKTDDKTTQRVIDGARLAGPVADRQLVSHRLPDYPEWAKSEGVEATVKLYFVVLPNGRVKENIMIQKTSGFQDFDRNAIEALLTWRFESLKGGETGEQWGSITFNFRLR